MEQPIHSIEYKDCIIEIHYDDCSANNPREWDNLGEIVSWANRYSFNDTDYYKNYDIETFQEEVLKDKERI